LVGSDFLTKSVSELSYNVIIPTVSGATVKIVVNDLEGFTGI